jgi:hypothetical protein
MKKSTLLLFLVPFLFACGENENIYPLTEHIWAAPEVLHVPDNVGMYIPPSGIYEFKSDGTYKSTHGANTLDARWEWLVEGEEFLLEYTPYASYNQIFTIVSMSDTLLHVKKRDVFELEQGGNYWEYKYRPY